MSETGGDRTRPRPRLLWVEDDPVIGEATELNLQRYDYDVTRCTDGLQAWQAFQTALSTDDGTDTGPDTATQDGPDTESSGDGHPRPDRPFDIVLSDVMLPGLDGISLCRRVREVADTAFLLVSARTDSVDIVSGLEAGADDYLTKPFDVQVLLARLHSVGRRAQLAGRRSGAGPDATGHTSEPATADAELEHYGDLTLDRRAVELRRGDEVLNLTPTEMRLFLELADEPGVVLSRTTLLTRVWDYPEWAEDTHLVNVHVQRLRAKIGNDRIETVRGFGYKLRR